VEVLDEKEARKNARFRGRPFRADTYFAPLAFTGVLEPRVDEEVMVHRRLIAKRVNDDRRSRMRSILEESAWRNICRRFENKCRCMSTLSLS
jgi:hypothetical protein